MKIIELEQQLSSRRRGNHTQFQIQNRPKLHQF